MTQMKKSEKRVPRKLKRDEGIIRTDPRAKEEVEDVVDIVELRHKIVQLEERIGNRATESWVWWRLAGAIVFVFSIFTAIGIWVRNLVSLLLEK